jgi:hypothetical protein
MTKSKCRIGTIWEYGWLGQVHVSVLASKLELVKAPFQIWRLFGIRHKIMFSFSTLSIRSFCFGHLSKPWKTMQNKINCFQRVHILLSVISSSVCLYVLLLLCSQLDSWFFAIFLCLLKFFKCSPVYSCKSWFFISMY